VGIEIFFLGLPGWFIAVGVYIICSKIFQKPTPHSIVTPTPRPTIVNAN